MFMGFFRYIPGLFIFHKVSQNLTEFQHIGRRKYAVRIEAGARIILNPEKPGRCPERLSGARLGDGYRCGAWW